MRTFGDMVNLSALEWEPVILARLLGCSHVTLRRFMLSVKPAPAPNVLVAGLLSLPLPVARRLGKASVRFSRLRRPLTDCQVWSWRQALCSELAANCQCDRPLPL